MVNGWGDNQVETVTMNDCANCTHYQSRFIEFPLTLNKIKPEMRPYWEDENCGRLVKIRPCNQKYGGKTYLGILLGELPYKPYIAYVPQNSELEVGTINNPAIFVPELKKIIFGAGSWWSPINSTDELKEITEEDIENVWYVKLLQWMNDLDKHTEIGSGKEGSIDGENKN